MKQFWAIIFAGFLLININLCAIAKENDINTYKLRDGHTVIIKEVHSNPLVTIDTWVKTGSVNENNQNNGVAHFLEHLFFKGTPTRKAGEFEKILESRGASYNAATSKDYTHFYITIASQYFGEAMDLHSDMLLHPAIPPEELKKERMVVQEEIRRSMDNPDNIVFDNLISLLFKSHPYRYDTLGTEKIIGSISREEIFNFYNKWYTPSNMITVITGDISTKDALRKVTQDFPPINTKSETPLKYTPEAQVKNSIQKIAKGDYNVGYIMIGFKGIDAKNTKESYPLDLAANILGDGLSSRLYREIKEKKNLVTSIDAGHYNLKDDSIFYVSANFKPQNYEAVKKAILGEIANLRTSPISQQELDRAKTKAERDFIYSNESIENIANSAGYSVLLTDDINSYKNYVDEIKKVTAQDILNVSQKYLGENQSAISVVMPNQIPVSNIIGQDKYKNVTKSTLSNGLTLISEKNTQNDIISLSIFLKGGNFIPQKAGVSSVVSSMLLKGTKNRSAEQLANEMENSGIIIAPSANSDYFEISMKSTKEDFSKAIELLRDIFNNPIFDQTDLDRVKNNMLQSIKQTKDDNFAYAMQKFKIAMFPNHPYGRVGEVLAKSIPTITQEDLKKYHSENFISQNMVVSVNGNIDTSCLIDIFENFADVRQGNVINTSSFLSSYAPLAKSKYTITPKDTETGWLVVGWPTSGMMSEKDYASLEIINSILGGGMGSRLFRDLREKQGLAYQIGSGYPSSMDNSFFAMFIGTKPTNLANVKKQFLEQIDKFKTTPLTQKELSDAKSSLVGEFARAHETNGEKAHYLGWYEVIGKDYKFNYNYPKLIESVNVDDIIKTANKYFNKPFVVSAIGPQKDVNELEKETNVEGKR